MKALIKVGYGCNNHCTFCHTLHVRDVEGDAREVHAKIERAAKLGHTMIVLSGGEVTMRPELMDWAAHSASLGLDFGLVTNGRMLAYADLVEKLVEKRLAYVYMSLHGGDAKIHNLMVRADGFEQAYAAIKNLSGRGIDFTVNTVVTRQNLRHLKPVVDAILPFPDVVLKFSMVQPKGGGEKLFDHLIPPVADVAAKVHEAIAYGIEKSGGKGPKFAHDGIPLCLLPGYEDLYDDLKTHRFWSMIEIGEGDFFPVDDKAKTHTDKCLSCAQRGPCPGLYTGYYESFGDAELKPVHDATRSNSFNYVMEKAQQNVRFDRCPVLADGVTPWDRGRHLYVRNNDRLVRFRADSRDFADAEIEHVKHDLGQVYLDVSKGKSAPDDFARDLLKLKRSAMCDGCSERARCTGMFEPVLEEEVFTRDDARVHEVLAGLEGDVLDVGCGEGPYLRTIEPAVLSSRVRYVGLEPDAKRAEQLRAAHPWATVRVQTAEKLAGEEHARAFDHALVLRSWNHLREPEVLVRALATLLRPGATITVVDNVAFGLARTKPQTARAEAGPAVFEHYRNDGAAEADACIRKAWQGAGGLTLEALERRDITPQSSNQWLLRYRVGTATERASSAMPDPLLETV